METQNVTLALPKEVLRKAKGMAIERRTSLSALVTKLIVDAVEQDDDYRAACERQLEILRTGFDWGSEGKITWTRDELHERK